MAEKSSGIGKSILSAVIVAAIVLPLGYVGFDFMRKEMGAHHTETRSVVLDLKNVAVEEIRASATKTADVLKNAQPGGGGEQLSADMHVLRQVTEQILAEQKVINENLSKVMKMETQVARAKPAEAEAPPADFEQTVYFAIGKASGSDVDTQIAKALPKMKDMLTKGPCRTDVTGFADTLGGDLSNLKLSRARADYVAAKLRTAGIDVYSVEAWGERRLKVHTYDGVKNENNRRADIEMHCGKKPKKAAAGS